MAEYITIIKKFIKKVGTVLADRRFWAFGMSIAIVFFGMPDTEVRSYAEAAVTILGMLAVLAGWTWRPPSGLDYKPVATQLQELIDALEQVGIQVTK